MDAYISSRKNFFNGIQNVEEKYLNGVDAARINFDSAYLYGLGYILAKKGAEQERLLDNGKTDYTSQSWMSH